MQNTLETSQTLADTLTHDHEDDPVEIAYVTCSYDTGFASLIAQISTKVEELNALWPDAKAIRWTLWIVDDLPHNANFSTEVLKAFNTPTCKPFFARNQLRCIRLRSTQPSPDGLKGRAILEGFEAALRCQPDLRVLTYINLNLKVHAGFSAQGVAQILRGQAEAAIGSRAASDGGQIFGAGTLGRSKSIAFNRLVKAMLPVLASYDDTNAPMKVFSPDAARFLYEEAIISHVTMDIEWLTMLHARGFQVRRFPVVWRQREGSHPPWHMIPASVLDIVRVRERWGS